MTKTEIAKKIVGTTAQYGSAIIVGAIVHNNVAPRNLIQKIGVTVASAAVAGAVGVAARNYTDRTIDELVTAFNELKKA